MHAFIVTGASRGLGKALVESLLADNHHVVGIARKAGHALENLAARYPERLQTVDADLSDPGQAAGAIRAALAQFPLAECGSLTLINNAGVVTPIAQAGHYPAAQLTHAIAVNVTAPMLASDAMLAATCEFSLKRRILNISSGAAAKAYPGWSVYCTTKAALDHFTRSVAVEQADKPNPAQIVALYPGVVDTDMQSTIRGSSEEQFPNKPRFEALKAEGNLATPADAARRIVDYLLSPQFGGEVIVDIREL